MRDAPPPRGPGAAGADDLEMHLRLNRATWTGLQRLGYRPGEPLDVDALVLAGQEAQAAAVGAALTAGGWRTALRPPRRRVLQRRTPWAVQASRRLPTAGLDDLDEMVERLIATAQEHGGHFDGWGAGVSPYR